MDQRPHDLLLSQSDTCKIESFEKETGLTTIASWLDVKMKKTRHTMANMLLDSHQLSHALFEAGHGLAHFHQTWP